MTSISLAAGRRRRSSPRQLPAHDAEGILTERIVEQFLPLVAESLYLAGAPRRGGAITREARRIALNLLVFTAAAAQGQLRPAAAGEAARLFKHILGNEKNPTRKPLIDLLRTFLDRYAAIGWRTLAPTLAKKSISPRSTSSGPAGTAGSNECLAKALGLLLGPLHPGGAGKPVKKALRCGIPGFSVRVLGAVHERLLGWRWLPHTGHPRPRTNRTPRRRMGSFYTPAPLARRLVEETVKPVLLRHLRALQPRKAGTGRLRVPLDYGLVVVDPAAGCGYFLTAAVDYLAAEISRFARRVGARPRDIARQLCGVPLRGSRRRELNGISAVKHALLTRAIRGYDTDRDSVELARVSLWLDSGLACRDVETLTENLQVRDPLMSPEESSCLPIKFDVVIGNPPYGVPRSRDYRERLKCALPLARSNPDLAAAFIERARKIVKPDGRIGLVLPKPLTYSHAWRHIRREITTEVAWLCDVGRGWDDVLLEQVLVVLAPSRRAAAPCRRSRHKRGRFRKLPVIPPDWGDRFDVLLSGLSRGAVDRLRAMQFADQTVGGLCRTFRGLPWQRRIVPAGDLPVCGGRDLKRWGIRSCSGTVETGTAKADLTPFAQPKLLFQNIIAHIGRPQPHIRLIGTWDDAGRITLDTVNNLIARRAEVDLQAVLALLHSEPVNWLVYHVIYNSAIRTMHFDQYFLDKIPLPPGWCALQPQLSVLGQCCLEQTAHEADSGRSAQPAGRRSDAENEIDRLVAGAYGLRARP